MKFVNITLETIITFTLHYLIWQNSKRDHVYQVSKHLTISHNT